MRACVGLAPLHWRAALAAGLLCGVVHAASAAPADMTVSRIVDNGQEVPVVEGAHKIELRPPSGGVLTRLERGQTLPPQTQVAPRAGVSIELTRSEPRVMVRVDPGTRLTVVRSDPRGAALDVGEGRASVSLLGRLDFFFGVTAFKQVLALARGTQFSVGARSRCNDRPDSPCVEVVLDEGRLELETRRPLQFGSAPSAAATDEATVVSVEPMDAGERRLLSLEPERFALRFDTPQAADAHFSRELEHARASSDPAATLRALRNLLVVRRLTDRHAEALSLADQGLQLARRANDRLWEFRFLIDQGLVRWQLARDRSALEPFELAFSMADVIATAGARTDLAALYNRYGNIRLDARDREKPRADDVDTAERFIRLGLQLRAEAAGGAPTLDLSMSHYALGMLMRIGRRDAAQSAQHLGRAVEIRRQVLGDRDDVSSAEMMSEAALSVESMVNAGPPSCPRAGAPDPYLGARRLFDDSLSMLRRLSPDRPYRSYAAVSRRRADMLRRIGDRLRETCGDVAAAAASHQAARAGYEQALEAWKAQAGNTGAERRFAWIGLGLSALALDAWADASRAFRQSYELALDERCSTPPPPEAPSFRWIESLVEQWETAAARGGDAALAAELRARRSPIDTVCSRPRDAGAGR